MGLLLVLRRVPLAPFWINFCSCFSILPGHLVRCLQVLFLLRYCSPRFTSRTTFWALLVPGHVAGLITIENQAAQVGAAEVARRVSCFGEKRFRIHRKTPAHLVGHCMHVRPRVWKTLHCVGYPGDSNVDCKRMRCNQHGDDGSLILPRTGVG